MKRETKADNLTETLLSVIRVGLLLVGIIGLAVSLFQEDGWLTQLLGRMFSTSLGLLSVPLLIFVIYLLNRWLTSSTGKASSRGDLPLYLMMAIGAFFLFRLITTGNF